MASPVPAIDPAIATPVMTIPAILMVLLLCAGGGATGSGADMALGATEGSGAPGLDEVDVGGGSAGAPQLASGFLEESPWVSTAMAGSGVCAGGSSADAVDAVTNNAEAARRAQSGLRRPKSEMPTGEYFHMMPSS